MQPLCQQLYRQVCSAKCCLTGCESWIVFTLPGLLHNYRLKDRVKGQWWGIREGKNKPARAAGSDSGSLLELPALCNPVRASRAT